MMRNAVSAFAPFVRYLHISTPFSSPSIFLGGIFSNILLRKAIFKGTLIRIGFQNHFQVVSLSKVPASVRRVTVRGLCELSMFDRSC